MLPNVRPDFRRETLLTAMLLLGLVALLYGHTLDVPFYLDDYGSIEENHRLRDLPAALRHLFCRRGLSDLTFAINFRLAGWSLAPLHLVNITLHLSCGVLVWVLLRQFLPERRWLTLGCSLLFLAHPLQTQSVTYLVQRSTVLATVGFLGAVFCHRRARAVLAAAGHRRSAAYLRPYVGAVLAGSCALLAKENAATLSLLLVAHDQLFPLPVTRGRWQALLDYLPFCVAPLIVGGAIIPGILTGSEVTSQTDEILSLAHNSPLHYLVTQFSVLWVYLRLLFIPAGQALEHDYPVVAQIFTAQSVAALAGWTVVAWLLWHLRRRRPLLVFGAAWWFCGLLVESSLIPLDPLFEHRLYLPMFGFVLVVLDSLLALLEERRALLVLALALAICLPLTWQRNALWRDPVAFYEDNLRQVPRSERAAMALMLLYKESGRKSDAEKLARELISINPRFGVAWRELADLLTKRGAGEEALSAVEEGLRLLPGSPELYRAGAAVYLSRGQPREAIAFLERGVTAAPGSVAMRNWLAALHFELGNMPAAETAYRESLRLNDRSAATRKNLARVLYAQGRMAEALHELQVALALSPGSPDILEGVARSALALGDLETAERAAARLRHSDPAAWRELQVTIALRPQGMP